jgi:hypothetical protein
MTNPLENAELDELIKRCKKLIQPKIQPFPPIHGSWVTEIEVGGVRIVLEVFVDKERPAIFDICVDSTIIYRETYSIVRNDYFEQSLASLRQLMVLEDLADV